MEQKPLITPLPPVPKPNNNVLPVPPQPMPVVKKTLGTRIVAGLIIAADLFFFRGIFMSRNLFFYIGPNVMIIPFCMILPPIAVFLSKADSSIYRIAHVFLVIEAAITIFVFLALLLILGPLSI